MATAAATSASFPHFPSLPSELRNQIWNNALPDKDEPALYFYEMGCWRPGRRVIDGDDALFLEFRHETLAHVTVAVPLASVNHEARSIALGWLREQGIERRFWEATKHHVFARQFDPNHDALYVSPAEWTEFCCEPWDRPFEPDLIEQSYSTWADVTRLALPESKVRSEAAELAETIGFFFPCLAILFIVIDGPPDRQLDVVDVNVQRRWELNSMQGRESEVHRTPWSDDHDHGTCYGDAALEERMEETKTLLRDALADDSNGKDFLKDNGEIRFQMWPAFAVRK